MNKSWVAIVASMLGSQVLAGELPNLDGRIFDAALECAGGDIKFGLRFENPSKINLRAFVLNGEESIPVPRVTLTADTIGLEFDYYDSIITARLDETGRLTGEWKKRRSADEWTTMKFHATPGGVRTMDFQIMPEWISGRWRVKFAEEADDAVAVFGGGDRRDLRGTFLTTTGDYRFLAGSADNEGLTLACFDGSHAFLFKAALQLDGSLKGDFWSGPTYHDTWTAVRDDNAALPDPFGITKFTGTAAALDALEFEDVIGMKRNLGRFASRVSKDKYPDKNKPDPKRPRIIELFGTWCPNCLDATRTLTELDTKYRDRGLAIVGLAFEVTGDAERDRKQVALYAERHNVKYPLLIAGKKDKAEASAKFPVIDKLRAYPTFIFIDAKGEVRGVYTGFSGPATGEEHERLKRAFESKVEEMLSAQ